MANGKNGILYGCLGCGVFLLLIFLLLGGGVGFVAWQGYHFGRDLGENYSRISQDYQQLNQRYPFTSPADGLFTEDRYQTFLKIRSGITDIAFGTAQKINQTGDEIGQQFEQEGILGKIRGFMKVGTIIRLAARMPSMIGKEHIQQLAQEKMSLKEYQWMVLTYLGTLYKAEENGFTQGAETWKKYLEALDKDRNHVRKMKINFDNHQFEGDKITRESLQSLLQPVIYNEQNATLIAGTLDRAIPGEGAALIDYLILHADEILYPTENRESPVVSDTSVSSVTSSTEVPSASN